jgi:cobalt-zinc-cadmium efflux system outer membrane protein
MNAARRAMFASGLMLVLTGSAHVRPHDGVATVTPLASGDTPVSVPVPADAPLDAVRAVQMALARHPDVRAELARLDVVEAERMQAGLLRNPMLSLMALRPDGAGGIAVDAGWMQSLFDLLTRSRRVARADAEARRVRAEVAMRLLEIGFDAQTAFHEAVAARARVRLLRAEVDLDDETLRLASRLHQRGLASQLSLLDLQAQRDERAHLLHEAETATARAESMLAERLGVASTSDLVLPDTIAWSSTSALALDDARAQALSQRPDLAASAAAMDWVGRERAIEGEPLRRFEPELGLRLERDAEGMVMVGPDLRIALPWFDRGQARTARLDALAREAEARDAALRQRVAIEVERAWRVLTHAAGALTDADRHLARARAADELSARIYRNGGIDRMARIERQRDLVQAERQQLDARAACAAAQVEVQRAMGAMDG